MRYINLVNITWRLNQLNTSQLSKYSSIALQSGLLTL